METMEHVRIDNLHSRKIALNEKMEMFREDEISEDKFYFRSNECGGIHPIHTVLLEGHGIEAGQLIMLNDQLLLCVGSGPACQDKDDVLWFCSEDPACNGLVHFSTMTFPRLAAEKNAFIVE